MSATSGDMSRRRLLLGGAALGAGALLAGCTSNEPKSDGNANTQTKTDASAAAPGKAVTIGFSAPAADHGWIGAITNNAKAQAAKFSDVTLKVVDAGKDAPAQIAALETMIASKPDAIVLLPNDGAQLTATGKKAMDAGIIVINLDREFSDPAASFMLIKGDNYGMGVSAGHFVGEKLKGNPNAIIGDTVLTCTVTYPPSMASSAIILARLAAQGKGMSDLVELQIPKLIVLQSEIITKDNVDKYLPLGFKS